MKFEKKKNYIEGVDQERRNHSQARHDREIDNHPSLSLFSVLVLHLCLSFFPHLTRSCAAEITPKRERVTKILFMGCTQEEEEKIKKREKKKSYFSGETRAWGRRKWRRRWWCCLKVLLQGLKYVEVVVATTAQKSNRFSFRKARLPFYEAAYCLSSLPDAEKFGWPRSWGCSFTKAAKLISINLEAQLASFAWKIKEKELRLVLLGLPRENKKKRGKKIEWWEMG